ncbi:MAG: ATP-grasp domain-containing protein [Tissierellia bacterium]|nr:ATP-grasp domain-containing protein [Tissierellia bacterium]
MKIAIVTDESRAGFIPYEESKKEDQQKLFTVASVMEILSKEYECISMVMDSNIINNLKSEKVDMVFNLCNGINGFSRLAQLPAMLESANIPYTGSAVLAHALAINKMYSCTIFKSNNIPTADFLAVYNMDDLENVGIDYPILVKPNDEGSSRGIHQDSLVFNKKDLYKKVEQELKIYNPPIILNEFIKGREFSIGILGNGDDTVILPIQEVDLSNLPDDLLKFYSFEIKSYYKSHTVYHIPAKLTVEEKMSIESVALKSYNSLMLKDYARVDIILKDGIPYVLEINSLPGLMRGTSALYRMAEEMDLGYEGLILKIVDTARKRYNI